MTSNSLSINLKRYFLQGLKSYWWLMVICGIGYFFLGPVMQMMVMQNEVAYLVNPEAELVQTKMLIQTARWFAAEGFLSYYVLGTIFAVLTGVVLFAYLHHKGQINFYHSQPIKRQKLFWNQYLLGLLINIIPMLLMTAVMVLLAFIQGVGEAVSLSVVAVHLVQIIIFIIYSYSLTILAGQLTGTVLTHICLAAVLHFGVPALVGTMQLLCDAFLHTFVVSEQLFDLSFYLSPFCALVEFLSEINVYYATQQQGWWLAYNDLEFLTVSKCIIFLLLSALFTAYAWYLYGKRPSEASGNALVYRLSEPILKFYLMLLVAIIGGILFEEIGNSFFAFCFGAVSCGLLVHMVCEVIIQKDFRAMLHHLSHAAVFLVIIFALVLTVRWDLIGYDQYLPKEDKVAEIRCEFSNLPDNRYYYNYNEEEIGAYKGEMIAPMLVMLGEITQEEYYLIENWEGENWEYAIRLDVTYVMHNGREVKRSYGSVPVEGIKDEFANIYNSQQYKEIQYGWLAECDGKDVETVYIRNSFMNYANFNLETTAAKEAFLVALRKDIELRQPENMVEAPILQVEIGMEKQRVNGRPYTEYQDLAIFASDKNVTDLLRQYAVDYQWPMVLSLEDIADEYLQLDVYKIGHRLSWREIPGYVNTVLRGDIGGLEWDDEEANIPDDIELIQTITGTENIRTAMKDLVSSGQLNENVYANWNRNYVVLATTKIDASGSLDEYYSDFAVDVSSQEVAVTAVERYTDKLGSDSRILYLKDDTADWLVK